MKIYISSIKSLFTLIFKNYPKLSINVNYDEYWDEKRAGNFGVISAFQKHRLKLVAKSLNPGKTLKDIGCGEGSFLFNLIKLRSFSKVFGIDVSRKALDFIANSDVEIIEAQIMDNSVRKSFPITDYSTLLELLEHTDKPEQILLDTISTTREKVIFSVPNTGYIAHRLRLLRGSFPYNGGEILLSIYVFGLFLI